MKFILKTYGAQARVYGGNPASCRHIRNVGYLPRLCGINHRLMWSSCNGTAGWSSMGGIFDVWSHWRFI